MVYDLKFVNLGLTVPHMVSSISVFGFRIAFYGIIIGIAMILGTWLAAQDAKHRGTGEDAVYDFIIYGILIGVAGARLYYVFFQWDSYKNDLLQIFNLRAGGLAIYGGVIGGILALVVWCRLKGKKFLEMADSLVLALLVGQILGRWGNFFNCEAFGSYTESLFAMRIRREIVKQLTAVKKQYAAPRRTEILYEVEAAALEPEDEAPPAYPVHLFLSREGYFKKITPQSLRMNGEQKYKEGDGPAFHWETDSNAELLLFTDRCQCYKVWANTFDDAKASVLGDFLPARLSA